jgi:hypothetical protein
MLSLGVATVLGLVACSGGNGGGPSAKKEMIATSSVARSTVSHGKIATDASGCPVPSPLALSPDDEQVVRSTTIEKLHAEGHEDAEIVRVYPAESPAPEDRIYAALPIDRCGPAIGSRTWVVEVRLPEFEPSRSLADVQYFVSQFDEGWRIWGSY